MVLQRQTAEPEQTFSQNQWVFPEQFDEGSTYQLQKFDFFFVIFGPFVVRHHLLEDAQSFCLEEKPLSVQQFFDLLKVVENAFI
jgi:hypothetical protein